MFHIKDAGTLPLAGEEHLCADCRRNAGRVADRLGADFLITLAMVARIVDVVAPRFAVFFTPGPYSDARFSLGSRAESGGGPAEAP